MSGSRDFAAPLQFRLLKLTPRKNPRQITLRQKSNWFYSVTLQKINFQKVFYGKRAEIPAAGQLQSILYLNYGIQQTIVLSYIIRYKTPTAYALSCNMLVCGSQ